MNEFSIWFFYLNDRSNCVVNLSPDKISVLREAYRVLKVLLFCSYNSNLQLFFSKCCNKSDIKQYTLLSNLKFERILYIFSTVSLIASKADNGNLYSGLHQQGLGLNID